MIDSVTLVSVNVGGPQEIVRGQQVRWMWSMLEQHLLDGFRSHPVVRALLPALEAAVAEGQLPPGAAVERLLQASGEHQ